MITKFEDRLLTLLIFVGYCIEFPKQMSSRIGGNPEWNRHVMYRAIQERYVSLFRREENRHACHVGCGAEPTKDPAHPCTLDFAVFALFVNQKKLVFVQ